MFAVCAIALLCLVCVSDSAPLACKDLVQPMRNLDPPQLEGTWALVAGSLKIIESRSPIELSDSVRVDFYNSTYTQANLFDGQCRYFSSNILIEGHNYNFKVGQSATFNGTLYETSCVDCVVLSFNVDAPTYKSMELYLFSKRREVDQKELEEFGSQVECLNMPKHSVLDPTKELCPDQAAAAAQGENRTKD
uniref:Apolipoprotein M n=1 Tax=Seriola lalandi dorsalis TaxID=1841481 RepID=A0A3B4XT66_SERLL